MHNIDIEGPARPTATLDITIVNPPPPDIEWAFGVAA